MTNSAGFSGDLNIISLQEVLRFLSCHRETGRLTMKTNSDEITVVFEHGAISSVSTNDCTLLIGRLLVDQGFVSEERIEQALALQAVADNPARIGDVLVEIGHVTREEINQAVEAQIEAALFRILIQSGGTFEYIPDRSSVSGPQTSGLELEPLVLNATYLADKWLADQSPSEVDTLPEGLIDPSVLKELPDPEREMLAELLDGYSSLHSLAWRTGLSAKHFKDSVEKLLQRALARAAEVKIQNEQITGREDSSYERVHLTTEVIDSWILDDLTTPARDALREILNGTTRMIPLARHLELEPSVFKDAIDELVAQDLIVIEHSRENGEEEEDRVEVPDLTLVLVDDRIPATVFEELNRSERRTLIEILNGRTSIHQMSQATGLPVMLFKEGADQLIDRGLVYTYSPQDPDVHQSAETLN